MDEFKHAEVLRKAEAAKKLLENDLLVEVLETLENEYVAGWRNTAFGDDAQREEAYFRLKALEQFKHDLEAVMNSGKVSAFNNRSKTRL